MSKKEKNLGAPKPVPRQMPKGQPAAMKTFRNRIRRRRNKMPEFSKPLPHWGLMLQIAYPRHNFARSPLALSRIMGPMKPLAALCLLCFASAWAQSVPSNLVVESNIPSIQVSLAGQDGGFYKFTVKNVSDHGV